MNDNPKRDENVDDIIKKYLALMEKDLDQRRRIENAKETLAALRKEFEKRKNQQSKCDQERLRDPDLGKN